MKMNLDWHECKMIISFQYDHEQLCPEAILDNLRDCIEGEGLGEIFDVEIK